MNCVEQYESINHRIVDCPKARTAWLKLDEVKTRLGLNPLVDLSIQSLLGAKDSLNKVELALNAELLHRLASYGGNVYNPEELVKSVTKVIGRCEPLGPGMRERFRVLLE